MAGSSQVRVGWLLAAVFGLAACLSAQTTGQTVRKHKVAEEVSLPPELVQAESAIEKNDYPAAQKLLESVTARDASSYRAWYDLGFVYNATGRAEDSIAAYRKAVAAQPDVFEANLNLGLMLARAGHPDAEGFLRAATKLKPSSHPEEGLGRAWLGLARNLEAAKPREAVQAYREAAKLQPHDAEPHLAAGILLERQNDAAGAEGEYKQAQALNPQSADAAAALANLYLRSKRIPEAETMLRQLAAQRPQDAVLHLQLARVLAASGRKDEAIAEYQNVLKLSPEDIGAKRDLADLNAAAHKFDPAEALYRELLKVQPDDADLHHALGKTLLEQHKFSEAQDELVAAVKLKPDLGAAYGDLAAAASENKQYELAIKALDLRAKFLPELPASYFLRASAYDHLRAFKPAAENYRKFLAVSQGQFPDQEWQARHRLIAIEPKK
jgi:tetratricopeptide (TPR) repeat protein